MWLVKRDSFSGQSERTQIPDTKKPATKPALSNIGAGNETRTRDPNLGKVVLYQLSYSRHIA